MELTPPPPNNKPSKPPQCSSGPRAGVAGAPGSWPQHHPTTMGTWFHKGSLMAEDSWAPSRAQEGTSPGGAETCCHPSPSGTPFPSTTHSRQSLVTQPVPISPLSSRSVAPSPHLPSQFSLLFCPLSIFFAVSQPFPVSCQPASGSSNLRVRTAWPETIPHGQATGSTVLRMAQACTSHW